MHKITMLGAGLIGRFYTISLQRLPDCEVSMVCSATEDEVKAFANDSAVLPVRFRTSWSNTLGKGLAAAARPVPIAREPAQLCPTDSQSQGAARWTLVSAIHAARARRLRDLEGFEDIQRWRNSVPQPHSE